MDGSSPATSADHEIHEIRSFPLRVRRQFGVRENDELGGVRARHVKNKVMRFEVVDEEEWQHRLNAMLAG